MVSVSVCMIVKNEEECLATCLKSLSDFADEIIIVDTGSTDDTKNIAKEFTDKVYDFKWTGDFSEARNFAWKKASCDYIYSADADEYIDAENQKMLLELKEAIVPEVEIVQFIYVEDGVRTVLNESTELRPKLYKRLRPFVWIDPVHETIRTLPVVYDSDIRVEHHPKGLHAPRDFSLIENAYKRDKRLSKNLYDMYAREVYKWGDEKALNNAEEIFKEVIDSENLPEDMYAKLFTVMAKSALAKLDETLFIKYTTKVIALSGCSEICCLLGDYFDLQGDSEESSLWYYNAIHEYSSILDSDSSGKYPQSKIDGQA